MEATQQLRPRHRELVRAALAVLGEEDDDVELRGCHVEPAAAPGDNLMGNVWRISTASSGVSLFLKTTHRSAAERDAYNSAMLYRNETAFYEHVIPELSQLLAPEQPPLAVPRCLGAFCDGGQDDALVLEDLRPARFQMADRLLGLDAPHCRLVLRELARLHALSLAMKSKQPRHFQHLKSTIQEALYSNEQRTTWAQVTTDIFEDTACMIEEMIPDKKYSNAVRSSLSGGFDFFVNMVKGDEPWAVINHGDCWTNNILFRYSAEEEPTDLRILDFQISRYCSLGLDVTFFLCTSVRPAVLAVKYDVLVREYHASLAATLEALGETAAAPTLVTVQEEVARCCSYGLAKAFVALPFFTRPAADVDTIAVDAQFTHTEKTEADSTDDVMLRLACNTKRKTEACRQWLAHTVKFFVDRGYVK